MSGALAVVLARAGSRGLPGKNWVEVGGRPMVSWTIEHALRSEAVDRVVVSTDGDEIAAVAAGMGVQVIERDAALAGDDATVDAAARHAVEMLDQQGETHDAVVILYGNVPVRPGDLTDRALGVLRETGCDSVQSVYRVGKTHPWWMKTVGGDADGGVLGMYQENAVYRRQDLPPVYMLDGGVIAVTHDALATVRDGEPHAFLGADRRAVLTAEGEVVDVDSPADLRVAEAVLSVGRAGHGESGAERPQMNLDEEDGVGSGAGLAGAALSERVIECAFEVANTLGTGFLEKVYEAALASELRRGGVVVERQARVRVGYKGEAVGEFYADLLVQGELIVELKACETIGGAHLAQALNYLRATGLRHALILNFGTPRVQIKHVAL